MTPCHDHILQHELAGPLYLRARKWLAASHCFEQVDNFGRALKILDEEELYDQAMDCLQRYKIRRQVKINYFVSFYTATGSCTACSVTAVCAQETDIC